MNSQFRLVGGTAWAFCDNAAVDGLDYLFVDEAGQVSIANLVGLGRCTKNIVLIGDQMQLPQPISGSHPGDSGLSTLQYLLQDQQTIRDDFGIFLGTSWRMHPSVCKFISGAVYDDRLHAEKHTENRTLVLPSAIKSSLKTAGISYVPVDHEGNTQGSDEEALVVKGLVKELLTCRIKDLDGVSERAVTLEDILIVAPYNMQVRKINDLLPGARVGSVDKFQGLEAAVVIVSMCSSGGESSSGKGRDFLFSKNRLNVAISRAQTLALIVAAPALANTKCPTVDDMELVNLFCRILSFSSENVVEQEVLAAMPS